MYSILRKSQMQILVSGIRFFAFHERLASLFSPRKYLSHNMVVALGGTIRSWSPESRRDGVILVFDLFFYQKFPLGHAGVWRSLSKPHPLLIIHGHCRTPWGCESGTSGMGPKELIPTPFAGNALFLLWSPHAGGIMIYSNKVLTPSSLS